MQRRIPFLAVLATAALTVGWARPARLPPAPAGDKAPPTFSVPGGSLRIEVCADDIVRVAFAKDEAFFGRPSLMAAPDAIQGIALALAPQNEEFTRLAFWNIKMGLLRQPAGYCSHNLSS